MRKGWGYGRHNGTDGERFNRNKILMKDNEFAKTYKTHGLVTEQEIILHDRRKHNDKSLAILKDAYGHKKCLDISEHFKSFKEVFEYIDENYKNNFLWN